MVKSIFPFFQFLTILLVGCHDKETISPVSKPEKVSQFIPVTQFIAGELNKLDSLEVAPLKIISSNNRIDSEWLKKGELRTYAKEFLYPIIDSIHQNAFFNEKSFLDQTINAYTFSYDPIVKLPDSVSLRRWDVYVDPEKNTISRVYIVKEHHLKNGGHSTEQLTWKSNESFKITLIEDKENEKSKVSNLEVIWNFKDNN